MKDIKIALIQTHWPGSREKIAASYRQLVREAAASGAQVVCLQEFALSPYFASTIDPHNRRWAEPLQGGVSERTFSDMARENGIFLVVTQYRLHHVPYPGIVFFPKSIILAQDPVR